MGLGADGPERLGAEHLSRQWEHVEICLDHSRLWRVSSGGIAACLSSAQTTCDGLVGSIAGTQHVLVHHSQSVGKSDCFGGDTLTTEKVLFSSRITTSPGPFFFSPLYRQQCRNRGQGSLCLFLECEFE